MAKFKQYEIVELTEDLGSVARGTQGTIIEVFDNPREGYEIEVVGEDGDTLAEFSALPGRLRAVPATAAAS